MSSGHVYRQSDRSAPRSIDGVWGPGYLKAGYLDADRNVLPELVAREHVEKLAKAIADAGMTRTQIRRYFAHCRAIEARVRAVPEPERESRWRQIASDFALLDSAAAYALSKSNSKIPLIFAEFIRRNVATVRNHEDFLIGFIRHFEMLIGFGWESFKSGAG